MPSSETALELQGSILIVDDEEAIRESLETLLDLEGYEVTLAPDASAGLSLLAKRNYDLVLLDLNLPDRNGLEVVQQIRGTDKETPVIVLTAYGSVENAVAAIKRGANDFFTKPWNNDKLLIEISRTISQRRLQRENVTLKDALRERYSFANIIGKSEPMQQVFEIVAQVAPTRSNVLIRGDSGTGKELIAKAIHANSPRSGMPFVAINTGSIPVDLLESTLFGHVRGAFTGASYSNKGHFKTADRGTLFLDEIDTLSLDTQSKLLRVLQEKEFIPVGSTETIKVDVRIVAATNVDLEELVRQGGFREDLYYRLNVIQIKLPPLRERREDIPLLAEHFFSKYCQENKRFLNDQERSILRFSPEAMRVLLDHAWPGNVRELENVVERAVVLAKHEEVPVELLPESLLASNGVHQVRLPANFKPAAGASLHEIVEEFERRLITDELEKCGWSQTECAKHMQVALSTLNQKIQRLNIDVKRKREVAQAR